MQHISQGEAPPIVQTKNLGYAVAKEKSRTFGRSFSVSILFKTGQDTILELEFSVDWCFEVGLGGFMIQSSMKFIIPSAPQPSQHFSQAAKDDLTSSCQLGGSRQAARQFDGRRNSKVLTQLVALGQEEAGSLEFRIEEPWPNILYFSMNMVSQYTRSGRGNKMKRDE